MPEEHTNVDYDAVSPAQSGPDNPYDDALAFKSLLGAVHGEFNRMVNDNMVSESNTLTKINGKAILEKGVKEIMGQQRPVNQIPQNIQAEIAQQPPPPQVQQATQPVQQATQPVQQAPQPITNGELIEQPQEDPNQLQLNFDNTATAQDIFNKLDDLEAKLNKLTRLVENITPSKKKTLVKK